MWKSQISYASSKTNSVHSKNLADEINEWEFETDPNFIV